MNYVIRRSVNNYILYLQAEEVSISLACEGELRDQSTSRPYQDKTIINVCVKTRWVYTVHSNVSLFCKTKMR